MLSNDNFAENLRGSARRARRFRLVCHGLAVLFLAIGLARLVTSVLPLVDPVLTTARIECDPCTIRTDPVLLLAPGMARQEGWRTGAQERIVERVGRPDVRLMLFSAQALRAIPFFVMFLALALALRSFARSGFNAAAVRWLRRAALGAVGWTLAQPVSMSIRWTALSPITHGRDLTHVVFDGNELVVGMLIAGAVWVAVWVLEEAVVMKRDLEEYV